MSDGLKHTLTALGIVAGAAAAQAVAQYLNTAHNIPPLVAQMGAGVLVALGTWLKESPLGK